MDDYPSTPVLKNLGRTCEEVLEAIYKQNMKLGTEVDGLRRGLKFILMIQVVAIVIICILKIV